MAFAKTVIVAALFLVVAGSSFAQAAKEPPKQQSPGFALPDDISLIILIKSTVIAVQHANATGNYSVIRDMGTPVFRERFDLSRLTLVFASLRAREINFGPALMLNPILSQQPRVTEQGQMQLTGIFPTQPLQIQFNLLFQRIDQMWRLEGIALDAVPVSAAQTSAQAVSPAPAPSTPEKKPGSQQAVSPKAKAPEKK